MEVNWILYQNYCVLNEKEQMSYCDKGLRV